jgi:hypothetical protein
MPRNRSVLPDHQSVTTVAGRLNVSAQTVRALCRSRRISAKWVFGCWHIEPDSVTRFLAGLSGATASEAISPSSGVPRA